jgi:hypothetical protein
MTSLHQYHKNIQAKKLKLQNKKYDLSDVIGRLEETRSSPLGMHKAVQE